MGQVFIRERGEGTPVVLLHGFPLNHTIWDSFAEKLAENFRVITPDLPGFGQSPLISPLTIDGVAQEIIHALKQSDISNTIVIGHSLGGYIALAMVDQNPDFFSALGLFHSTALADSIEKKESRNKVLDFIDKHGVRKFTSNFIGPLFANQQHSAIGEVQSIAVTAKEETVKAYTLAMRDRDDHTQTLEEFNKPILLIAGEKDAGIPVESVIAQSKMNRLSEIHILTSVAHMGMIESEQQSLAIIKRFIKKNAVTS